MLSLLSSRFSNLSQSSLTSPIEPNSSTISLYQQDEGLFSSASSSFPRAHPPFAPEDDTITGPRALSAFQQMCISQEYVPCNIPPSSIPISSQRIRPSSPRHLYPHDRTLIRHIGHPDAHFWCARVIQRRPPSNCSYLVLQKSRSCVTSPSLREMPPTPQVSSTSLS